MSENENGDYEVEIVEGFRKESVEGAIILSMGIIESAKDGSPRAFIEVDDEKGMLSYLLQTSKGAIGNINSQSGKYEITDYFDIGKLVKSMKQCGLRVFFNFNNKVFRTDPDIVGQKVWIKYEKTSTSQDGKEYGNCITMTKFGDGLKAEAKTSGSKKEAGKDKVEQKSKDELKEEWLDLVSDVTKDERKNKLGIQMALKAKVIDEAHRTQLSKVRDVVLSELVKEGLVQIDEDGKYYT